MDVAYTSIPSAPEINHRPGRAIESINVWCSTKEGGSILTVPYSMVVKAGSRSLG